MTSGHIARRTVIVASRVGLLVLLAFLASGMVPRHLKIVSSAWPIIGEWSQRSPRPARFGDPKLPTRLT